MTGNVHIEQDGPQPMQGDAGRVILDFDGQNQLQKVHAMDGVRLTQKAAENQPAQKGLSSGSPDFELTAPIIDFKVTQGHILQHAVTSGAARITITQTSDQSSRRSGRTHRQLRPRRAGSHQHQPIGGCQFPSARWHRLYHATGQRRLYRRATGG